MSTAYELDLFWPPTVAHAAFARHIVAGELEGLSQVTREHVSRLGQAADGTLERALFLNLADRQDTRGELFPRIREFAGADPDVQRLIDPSCAAATPTGAGTGAGSSGARAIRCAMSR